MKRRLAFFMFIASIPISACAAPSATPTAAPSSTAAVTAQVAQPTIAATIESAIAPTTVPATAAPTSAQIVEATAAPTAVAPPLARTLSLQQPPLEGEDVRTLQQRLLDLGYAQLGSADGIFGPNTETAVRAFQTLNRIEVDGIVGPDTWAFLYGASPVRYDLHPIVDTQRGYLLGASNDDAWIEANVVGDLVGKTSYQLLSQTGAERANGAAPRPIEGPPCEETRLIDFGSPVDAEQPIALAGDWNPLPRPVTEVPTDTATLQAPVATALQVLGLKDPNVRITRALRADLDDDGNQETVLGATYWASGVDYPQPSAKTGDYSVLLVLPEGANAASVIAATAITADIEFGAPTEFRLLGLWDLNGDGTLEIAATGDYYEGASTSVYTLNGTAAKEVLIAGCGV